MKRYTVTLALAFAFASAPATAQTPAPTTHFGASPSAFVEIFCGAASPGSAPRRYGGSCTRYDRYTRQWSTNYSPPAGVAIYVLEVHASWSNTYVANLFHDENGDDAMSGTSIDTVVPVAGSLASIGFPRRPLGIVIRGGHGPLRVDAHKTVPSSQGRFDLLIRGYLVEDH